MLPALLTTSGSSDNSVPLRLQKVLTAIKVRRRRAVIIELDQEDTPVSLSELVERIAADEYNKHRDKLTAQERKRVYIALYQVHLGKLHDVGAIAYNEDEGMIDTSNATQPLAELIREIEDRCISVDAKS
jgi:hypothetical protein